MAVLATSKVILETKKQVLLVNTPSNGGQDVLIIVLVFPHCLLLVLRRLPVIK